MKIFLLLSLLLLNPFIMQAQHFPAQIDETNLQFQVKQMDEFMRRFNYTTRYDGSEVREISDSTDYKNNLKTLFKHTLFSQEEIEDFCNHIMDRGIKLNYTDDNWTAEVSCDCTLKGKHKSVDILLRTELMYENYYRWAVVDVSSDFLCQEQISANDSLFISPAEHGISFITLPRIINNKPKSVSSVYEKGWKQDNLSVFNYMIKDKLLVLGNANNVTFHFQIEGYDFDVERFVGEDTPNQGWLISKITKKSKQ